MGLSLRRVIGLTLTLAIALSIAATDVRVAFAAPRGKPADAPKPWCAPEVNELSDHVCWFDGGPHTTPSGAERRTLVIYLHGSLAPTPGFQYLQQRGMAIHAKRQHFTVLIPTSPNIEGYFVWPTGRAAQAEHEARVIAGLRASREKLERTMGVHFDETFVVGFSSGAYYGSSLALRGALDSVGVDGYLLLAGGSTWVKPVSHDAASLRVPVFVGVSARDPQTRDHSRALAAMLGGLGWAHRVEERDVGHAVDWGFMDHGVAWLRARMLAKAANE